jgi:hypothetical protein
MLKKQRSLLSSISFKKPNTETALESVENVILQEYYLHTKKTSCLLMEPSIPAPNPRNNGRNGGWKALQNHLSSLENALVTEDEEFMQSAFQFGM